MAIGVTMSSFKIKSSLSIIIFTVALALSGRAISEMTGHQQTTGMTHPLTMAHQQLSEAHQNIKNGNVEAFNKNLQTAEALLQDLSSSKDEKTKEEAKALMLEIRQLHQQDSENKEGVMSRLWHRSNALLNREVTKLSNSWSESSSANKTLKHLLDARLHFNYAKHDLFVSHNLSGVKNEIEQTFTYLDKASSTNKKVALKEEISSIKQDINYLLTDKTNTVEEQKIIKALSLANENMLKVSQNTSAGLKIQSKKIADEIIALQRNIIVLEKEEQYDALMKRLEHLDKLL